MRYQVTKPVKINGKRYKPGDHFRPDLTAMTPRRLRQMVDSRHLSIVDAEAKRRGGRRKKDDAGEAPTVDEVVAESGD